MIKILFFGRLREALQSDGLELEPEKIVTVRDVKDSLSIKGPLWEDLLDAQNTLIALNQTIVDELACVKDGDEIAFFPPVTGG